MAESRSGAMCLNVSVCKQASKAGVILPSSPIDPVQIPAKKLRVQYSSGFTISYQAAFNNANPAFVQLLVDHGAWGMSRAFSPPRDGLLSLIVERDSEMPRQEGFVIAEEILRAIGAMTS